MECPNCQFENRDGAKFCNRCGYKFPLTCPECDQINPPASKFCNECGYNFKPPKETPDDISVTENLTFASSAEKPSDNIIHSVSASAASHKFCP